MPRAETDAQTIADFGEQWQRFTDNEGYYGSGHCLQDIFGDQVMVVESKPISKTKRWVVEEIVRKTVSTEKA